MKLIERDYMPVPQDGTSTWQVLEHGEDFTEKDDLASRECNIVIGDTAYPVRITSDNEGLVEGTANYHETNNLYLPPPNQEAKSVLNVFYATENDIELQETTLRVGSNPYVAGMTKEGAQVFATGKVSVGTLKSICFGAVSTLACRGKDYVPLHASIGQTDGENAFAVSGRGNWGKTTSMIGAKIAAPEITVVTDDWSLVDVSSREVVPIDMLVAIRPEAVSGIIAATYPEVPPSFLETAQKDGGKLFSVYDIFGNPIIKRTLQLQKVLLADKRVTNSNRTEVYDAKDLGIARRLKDDAYHAPDIDEAYDAKYHQLVEGLDIGAISTALPNHLRSRQLANIIHYFKG